MRILLASMLSLGLLAQTPSALDVGVSPGAPQLFQAGHSYTESLHRSLGLNARAGLKRNPINGEPTLPPENLVFAQVPQGVSYPKGKFSMVVLPGKTLKSGDGMMAVLLVNDTDRTQVLSVWDGGFYFIQEAKLIGNPWNPLEYVPAQDVPLCGNDSGFGSIQIPSHGCFAFSARRYRGSVAAHMRLVISKAVTRDSEDLISNEFEGSIAPTQFSLGLDLSDFVLGGPRSYEFPYIPPDAIKWPKVLKVPKVGTPWAPGSAVPTWKACGAASLDSHASWSDEIGNAPAPAVDQFVAVHIALDAQGRVLDAHKPSVRNMTQLPECWVEAVAFAMSRACFQPATVDGVPVPCVAEPPTLGLGRMSGQSHAMGLNLLCRPAAFLGVHPGFRGFTAKDRNWGIPYLHVVIGVTGKIQSLVLSESKDLQRPNQLADVRRRLDKVRFEPATINGSPVPFECLLVEEKPE